MVDLHEALEACVADGGTKGFLAAYRWAFSPALLMRLPMARRGSLLEAALMRDTPREDWLLGG